MDAPDALKAMLAVVNEGRETSDEPLVKAVGKGMAMHLAERVLGLFNSKWSYNYRPKHPWRFPGVGRPEICELKAQVDPRRGWRQALPKFLAADPGLGATFEVFLAGEPHFDRNELRIRAKVPVPIRHAFHALAAAYFPDADAVQARIGYVDPLLIIPPAAVPLAAAAAIRDLVRLVSEWETSRDFNLAVAGPEAPAVRTAASKILGLLNHHHMLRYWNRRMGYGPERKLSRHRYEPPLKLDPAEPWCMVLPKLLAAHPGLDSTFEIDDEVLRIRNALSDVAGFGLQDLAFVGQRHLARGEILT